VVSRISTLVGIPSEHAEAMQVAASIDIYTNDSIVTESLEADA